ncbi:TIGR03960 family B12-binding radical SAM protein [Dethiosulfatarculus sandiegensis]|uniref:Radical SAM protein n=1 Tax=Dethiosulfatarculus sandiegensis TaxID=1429043 RepID=A0A0D2GDS1_9BACT|nr:TIGR03960 family B12-binding radical SAM protein [Dethiosulfatarculus sandiegensis]KIX13097.1 radical SAM protein [Dethiosulfatarculus sandiegensis]
MNRQSFLNTVMKPARYLGGEAGQVVKDPEQIRLTFALAFPEIYEIAMSHMGIKILYDCLAKRPDVAAERVFAPWVDLMDLMSEKDMVPWSLETGRELSTFDVIGFSLQYEMTYTNVLKMLELSGVPFRREERGAKQPIVIAGGPCMVNPEPVADFMDLCVVGEAEDLMGPLMDVFIKAKEESWERGRLYREASCIEGVYAPALFEPLYENGRLKEIKPLDPEFTKVRRRVVADMDSQKPPETVVSPVVKPVHDRLGVEVARGCTRGCRFCQAGFIYRPVRERKADTVVKAVEDGLNKTGLEEVGLLSLSTGDYTCIDALAKALMDTLEQKKVSLSLPSLRVDSLSDELMNQIKRVRKTGFTLAPEAGSGRMRQVINKDLSEEQILSMAARVYGLGWNLMKLYFMLGLPTETDEDLEAIGRLSCQVAALGKKGAKRGRGKKPLVNSSLGIFVPKPHTPFQWEGQIDLEESYRRLKLAKSSLGDPAVKAKWNDPRQSLLEGVLSRGDRRLSRVLELAVKAGCRFDGWSEKLSFDTWIESIEKAGLTVEEYLRPRDTAEVLPWDHIDVGVTKKYLLKERNKSLAQERTGDCRKERCTNCGVCDHKNILPRLAETPPQPLEALKRPESELRVLRFRLEKTGPARYQGHLEMISQLVRSFRRAGVELAYSRGYHPHPHLKTDSALPLGVESLVETLEVGVYELGRVDEIAERVNWVLPLGLCLADGRPKMPGEKLAEPHEVTYMVSNMGSFDKEALDAFEKASEFTMVRKTPKGNRTLDLKASVKELKIEEQGLFMVLAKAAGGRPKPYEILENVLGLSPWQAKAGRALKIKARREG